jgi:hypothetical protein
MFFSLHAGLPPLSAGFSLETEALLDDGGGETHSELLDYNKFPFSLRTNAKKERQFLHLEQSRINRHHLKEHADVDYAKNRIFGRDILH